MYVYTWGVLVLKYGSTAVEVWAIHICIPLYSLVVPCRSLITHISLEKGDKVIIRFLLLNFKFEKIKWEQFIHVGTKNK